jgi:hypothetical protein
VVIWKRDRSKSQSFSKKSASSATSDEVKLA